MNFFDLNDDVKSTFSKHFWSDYKISTLFMSKHQNLQKYYLVRLYLMMIFINLKQHMVVWMMMVIFTMLNGLSVISLCKFYFFLKLFGDYFVSDFTMKIQHFQNTLNWHFFVNFYILANISREWSSCSQTVGALLGTLWQAKSAGKMIWT